MADLTEDRVRVSSDDRSALYLASKIIEGNNITIDVLNAGGSEVLKINASSGSSTTPIDVEDDGNAIVTDAGTVNLAGGEFDVTNPVDSDVKIVLTTGGIDNTKLANSSVTVAGNSVSLGGSTSIAIADLTGVLADAVIKNSGDNLEWQTDGNNDLVLQNTTDATTLLTIDQDTGDITFDTLSGSPSFGGHDHTSGALPTIPNTGLTNSSITVAGNSVSLGGSTGIALVDLSNVGSDTTTDGNVLASDGTDWDSESISTLAGSHLSLSELSSKAHSSLTAITSSDHHTKTTDMDDLNDVTGVTAFEENTSANLPTAGTEGRIFFETDTGRVLYDNGTTWIEIGLSESQISLANLASNAHSDLTGIGADDHHAQDHASRHFDGGADELDAADLAGALGTDGQVLTSTGSTAQWEDVSGTTDTRVDVEDDGVAIVSDASVLNFAGGYFGVTNPTGSEVDVSLTDASIENAKLDNSSITIAGNSVSLGDSTTPDASDFSGADGTDGQVLTSTGTGAQWEDPSGGDGGSHRNEVLGFTF
jgi:hypothetical protein